MIFLIHGDDDCLIDRRKNEIRDRAAKENRECDSFRAGEKSAAEIADSSLNLSLFASQKTVFIDHLDDAPKKDLDELAEKLVPTPDGIDAVFVWRERVKPTDRPPAGLKKIMSAANVMEERRPRGRDLVTWTRAEARRFGKEIADEAAEFLAREAVSGADMGSLAREIEKCAMAVGERREITAADAARQIFAKGSGGIFEFADALERRDKKSALKTLGRLLEGGEEPLLALDRFYKTFLRIYRSKILAAEGVSSDEISRILFLSHYFDKKFFSNAAGHTVRQSADALALATACNLKLKRARTSEEKKSALAVLVSETLK